MRDILRLLWLICFNSSIWFEKKKKMLSKTIDTNHFTIYKLRRCFQWCNRYYQLDIYEEPCNPSCRGLAILSTHSMDQDLLLPDFLHIENEVTNDSEYSMFNLSRKHSHKNHESSSAHGSPKKWTFIITRKYIYI